MEDINNNNRKKKLSEAESQELRELRRRYIEIRAQNRASEPFQLARLFPDPEGLDEAFARLTELKACLDSFRPLNEAHARKLKEAFDVEYTFDSNRIEGNTLTLRETDLVVNKGLTISGKPMREHLEAINHQEAIEFIRELAGGEDDISERTVREIHTLILRGIDRDNAGRYRSVPVQITGSGHVPPQPYLVAPQMEAYFRFHEDNKDQLHPVALAAHMHEKLVTIHPFIDGNGRTARLIMNLILLKAGYPISVISGENEARQEYYRTLEVANRGDNGDNTEFQRFVVQNVKAWLIRYLDLVSVDTNEDNVSGYRFFKTIERHLG